MRRLIMPILACLSVVLLIVTSVLWVRSVRTSDFVAYTSDESLQSTRLRTVPHGIEFGRTAFRPRALTLQLPPPTPGWNAGSEAWGSRQVIARSGTLAGRITVTSGTLIINFDNRWTPPANSFAGFGWQSGGPEVRLLVPMWLVAMLTLIAPAMWLLSRRHLSIRREQGLCLNCGYDLRASAERCPECGSPIAALPRPPSAR